jgi:RNA polymerase sigma-70 factor, ECF subfamily
MLMVLRRVDDTAFDATRENEQQMLSRLRSGDEAAFIAIVGQLQGSLIRVARHYVRDRETAEEVVQETWLGVLQGLDRFEERSSLKTWIFRILVNRARSRGVREARTIAVSQLAPEAPAVEPERFLERGPATGHWASRPVNWEVLPESTFLAQETLALIRQAIALLPANQREVITLRDVEGWSASEVCNILEITETNQRVLLHRARSKVRAALEQKLIER